MKTLDSLDEYKEQRQTEIGERVKKLRRQHKWSQADLANFLGCSRARVNRAESGSTAFDVAELEVLAQRFNTTILDLLGWKFSTQLESPKGLVTVFD